MKVATKLSASFGLLVVILAGLLVYHVRTTQRVVSATFELAEITSRTSSGGVRQVGRLNELEENAGKYWVTHDPGYLLRFREAFEGYDAGLRELAGSPLSDRERDEFRLLEAQWQAFGGVAARLGDTVPPQQELYDGLDGLRDRAQRLGEASQAAMRARLDASAGAARRAERISWAAAAGTLLLSVLVFSLIVRSSSSARSG